VGSVAPLHASCSAQAAVDEDALPPQQQEPEGDSEAPAQPAVAITITDA
jgi:hypothetical protein